MILSESEQLFRLLSDNISGSSTLLSKLNDYFKQLNHDNHLSPSLILEIQEKTKPFQNIQNYLKHLLELLDSNSDLDQYFCSFNSKESILFRILSDKLKTKLKPKTRIVTFSNSKTITEVLSLLNIDNYNLDIYISESRPMNEGRIMCLELAERGIKVTLVTEAMLSNTIEKCDFVLIGADIIMNNCSIVNKVGSRSLAIICKYFKKDLYVISSSEKRSGSNNFTQRFGQRNEIWDITNNRVEIINSYFEVVEKELISEIITD